MKNLAANCSLVLSVVSAPVIYYAALSALGDPDPKIPSSVIASMLLWSQVVLAAGILGLCISLWLSGFAFSAAPKRSILSGLLCLVSLCALYLAP